ncbi:MAG TPA: selenocysteine-specific translation elongation factor [Ktedonobacterales bacterium]
MSCIGTAGHVDHGKSTLVTALTGIDPDRLAEEKARGMTIDLGFAWLTLPSGREASIVDVPGHESFIKNMLAGVGGIDVALLVVAADEGVMPQTAEHLAILDLLRVRAGVVALTKADLVDAEWLALVREELAETLAPTTLAGAPIIACSAVSGQGLPELLAALDAALDSAPGRRDLAQPRLPIDRVFTITGFGTVVTGTLQDGALRTGQEVEILPRGTRARIRGLQTHKRAVEVGAPGGRLAVNLAGVAKSDLARGDVLALPGQLQATTALDVRLEVLAGAPRPVAHNVVLDLYLGASETSARIVLLDGDEVQPGDGSWAQLRLAHPIVAAWGDRFILRVPSPSLTIGGGLVVEPWARRHRRRDAGVLARLETLARGNPEEIVLAALREGAAEGARPVAGKRMSGPIVRTREQIAGTTGLPSGDVGAALAALIARQAVMRFGDRYLAADEWDRVRALSNRLLSEYHQQHPLRLGMPREEWRSRLGLSAQETVPLMAALTSAGALVEVGGAAGPSTMQGMTSAGGRGTLVRMREHEPRLTQGQESAVTRMLERFAAEPFAPPVRTEVEQDLGAELAALLVERGSLVRVGESLLFTRPAYEEAVRRLVTALRSQGTLTVAAARDILGTSRKYVLPLLEHLDERRITLRRGDDRILGPAAP